MSSEKKDAVQDEKAVMRKLLSDHLVSEVMHKGRKVIEVKSSDSPKDAFVAISEAHVLSAPVWDEDKKEYCGFLDSRDLVPYVLALSEEMRKHKEIAKEEAKRQRSGSVEEEEFHRGRCLALMNQIGEPKDPQFTTVNLAKRNAFCPVGPEDSMLKVAELLQRLDVHRVPVIDPQTKHVVDIISQSDVVNFLWRNHEKLHATLSQTVEQTKLGTSPVLTVKSTTKAEEALQLMAKHNLSGIALVDKSGRFVGNTSGSDVKLLLVSYDLRLLTHTIMDFLAKVRQADVTADIKSPVIAVHPKDTVEKVVGKLCATRVHRVFVTDPVEFKPLSVISLADVLKYALAH